MNELWCCFDWEEEEAEYAFECQAPVRRGMSKNEIPSPQKNSIRSDMALPSIPDSELGSYFEVQPIDPLPVCRLFAQSGKIATRRARGPYEFRSEEFTLLLQCYEHDLSLGHPGCDYRDAVIDAMVESLDDYASATYPDWGQLLAATKGHPMCSMWRLVCFFNALATLPEYVLSSRSSGDETLER
jgi:hypothetical protein